MSLTFRAANKRPLIILSYLSLKLAFFYLKVLILSLLFKFCIFIMICHEENVLWSGLFAILNVSCGEMCISFSGFGKLSSMFHWIHSLHKKSWPPFLLSYGFLGLISILYLIILGKKMKHAHLLVSLYICKCINFLPVLHPWNFS